MMEKETTKLWIKKRGGELKVLEEEIEGGRENNRKKREEIDNCIEEIEFIRKLQSKEIGPCEYESGKELLEKMKEELEGEKKSLEEALKEFEEKNTRSKNLSIYIDLAHREW